MKKFITLASMALIAAIALSGCGKASKSGSPTSDNTLGGTTAIDRAQVMDAVAANPALVNESLTTDPNAVSMFDGGIPGPAPITRRPLRWWRTIDSVTTTTDYVYSDPDSSGRPMTAIATVHKHIMGKFHVTLHDSLATTTTLDSVYVKPLDDTWTRLLELHRFRIDTSETSPKHEWRVTGTSGALVTSAGATTAIQSVEITTGSKDTTITDPLALHKLRKLMGMPAFGLVTLKVTTGRASDVVVLYRMGDRRPFKNNGDGTFTATFYGLDFGGLQHLGVNAFSNGAMNTPDGAYDSQAWVWPFASRDGDRQIDRGHDGGTWH